MNPGPVLRCALEIMPNGTLRWADQYNRTVIATTDPIALRKWVRIEWMVDHISGRMAIKLFNVANSSKPIEEVESPTNRAIGPPAQEIQIGRSGSQPFEITFWTDEPALSTSTSAPPDGHTPRARVTIKHYRLLGDRDPVAEQPDGTNTTSDGSVSSSPVPVHAPAGPLLEHDVVEVDRRRGRLGVADLHPADRGGAGVWNSRRSRS